jgi:hypothetical protein
LAHALFGYVTGGKEIIGDGHLTTASSSKSYHWCQEGTPRFHSRMEITNKGTIATKQECACITIVQESENNLAHALFGYVTGKETIACVSRGHEHGRFLSDTNKEEVPYRLALCDAAASQPRPVTAPIRHSIDQHKCHTPPPPIGHAVSPHSSKIAETTIPYRKNHPQNQ